MLSQMIILAEIACSLSDPQDGPCLSIWTRGCPLNNTLSCVSRETKSVVAELLS